jgi:transposase
LEDVTLSAKEKYMYEAILQVIDGTLTHDQAALRLGVTRRTVERKIAGYLNEGMPSFSHGLKGRVPTNATDLELWSDVIALYRGKYKRYNWTHFRQRLAEVEGIEIGYATLYSILTEAGYTSPKAHRERKKKIHPLRPRRKHYGELVQMDASKHVWFGDSYCHLHLAIDDATSQILGAYFLKEETLSGYYEVFRQILVRYGVPREFYTDRRTVFEYKRKGEGKLELDYQTQFQLAAAQLGVVRINTTSVPQAKGRVERSFQTLQDRLINEMQTAGVTSIDEANAFLPAFIADHNARYAP